jgi:hypothetical protein
MSNSLSNSEGLITATIKPKTQTYHLVTEETLGAIKEKSTVADILMLITSLLFGAFFSVLIALNASVGLPKETVVSLSIYQWVFFGFGVLFLVMTIITVVMGHKIIRDVKSPQTTITTDTD